MWLIFVLDFSCLLLGELVFVVGNVLAWPEFVIGSLNLLGWDPLAHLKD